MGLSIHYSGEFDTNMLLSSMIEEVVNIAEVYNWKYFVFDEAFDKQALGVTEYTENLYGISFTPKECETIYLTFLSNGRMASLPNLKFYGESETHRDYLYMLSVKTQYGGIEIHKLIIHLLKYLNEKYFSKFELSDEGQYWETRDEQLLQEVFARYDSVINSFSSALDIYPKLDGENFEDYFSRLISQVRKQNNPPSTPNKEY